MDIVDPLGFWSEDDFKKLDKIIDSRTEQVTLQDALFKANEELIKQLLDKGWYTTRKEALEVALENVECLRLRVVAEQNYNEKEETDDGKVEMLGDVEMVPTDFLDKYRDLFIELTPKLKAVNAKLCALLKKQEEQEQEEQEREREREEDWLWDM